jgi:hypothetical protein
LVRNVRATTATEDHGDARRTSPRSPATHRYRVSAIRRGCVARPSVGSLHAFGDSMSEGPMPTPVDRRGVAGSSSAIRRRRRDDANAPRWPVSRSAPLGADSAKCSRATPRAADRSDGGADVLVWSVATRRVDAGVREFPPRARAESGSRLEARPIGQRTGQSSCRERHQSLARNRNGHNTYRIFSKDSCGFAGRIRSDTRSVRRRATPAPRMNSGRRACSQSDATALAATPLGGQ